MKPESCCLKASDEDKEEKQDATSSLANAKKISMVAAGRAALSGLDYIFLLLFTFLRKQSNGTEGFIHWTTCFCFTVFFFGKNLG